MLSLHGERNGKMIEVYSQNLEGTWYGIACANSQIYASTFSTSQQTTLTNLLTNIPYNTPFQVFHHPSTFAKTVLTSIKEIYQGRNADAGFSLAYSRMPAYSQRVLKTTAADPNRLRDILRFTGQSSRRWSQELLATSWRQTRSRLYPLPQSC